LELAASLDIPVDDGSYTVSDVYMADEAFISGTRYCMLPVATVNGLDIGSEVPGPTTGRLLAAWSEEVGIDFVKQALDHLPSEDTQVIPTSA
jgi:branched-subunit amino acid aminotransferase/4-amino-4-deoxychorismate lyase